MRRDSSFVTFVSDALIDQPFHAFDELRGCEPGARVDGATEPAIDDAAHTFKHAPQKAFMQRLFPLFLYMLVVRIGHEYAIRVFRRDGATKRRKKQVKKLVLQRSAGSVRR